MRTSICEEIKTFLVQMMNVSPSSYHHKTFLKEYNDTLSRNKNLTLGLEYKELHVLVVMQLVKYKLKVPRAASNYLYFVAKIMLY